MLLGRQYDCRARLGKGSCYCGNESMAVPTDQLGAALAGLGSRLKQLRQERSTTLAALSRETGISVSTLSRLEAGLRRPTLELLLPIARAHQVSLDEIVGALLVDDPRIPAQARRVDDGVVVPLTRHAASLQAFKMTIPATRRRPDPRTHQGYEWLYVLSGRLRLVVAQHDLVMEPGQAAEFDTRTPHWFGSTGDGPVEILSLFGSQGERMLADVLAEGGAETARRGAAAVGMGQRSRTIAHQSAFETPRLTDGQAEHHGGFPELQLTGDDPGKHVRAAPLPGRHADPLPLLLLHERTKSQIA